MPRRGRGRQRLRVATCLRTRRATAWRGCIRNLAQNGGRNRCSDGRKRGSARSKARCTQDEALARPRGACGKWSPLSRKTRRGRQPDRREARFFTVVPARALLAALEQRLCDTKVHSAQAGSGGTVRGSTTTPRGAQRAYRPEARTPGRAPAVARPPSTLSDVTTLGSPSVGTAAGDSPTSRVQGCRRRGAPWPRDPAQLAGVAPHAFVRDATRRRRATAGVRSRVQPLKTKKTEKPNAAKRVGGRRSANYATFLSAVPNVLVPRSTAPPPTLPSSACTTMVRTTAAYHNTPTHVKYDSD